MRFVYTPKWKPMVSFKSFPFSCVLCIHQNGNRRLRRQGRDASDRQRLRRSFLMILPFFLALYIYTRMDYKNLIKWFLINLLILFGFYSLCTSHEAVERKTFAESWSMSFSERRVLNRRAFCSLTPFTIVMLAILWLLLYQETEIKYRGFAIFAIILIMGVRYNLYNLT